jgi:transposase-like protein
MRYPASAKLEIIRIVEQSHLPAKRTLDQLGIPRRTFYRWYDRYLEGGPEALEDRPSAPSRVWNRIGGDIQGQIVEMALEATELSPRELALRFTDERSYFVSEATVYRLLKAHDLITSPAYVVIKAADQFHTKTSRCAPPCVPATLPIRWTWRSRHQGATAPRCCINPDYSAITAPAT